MNMLLLSSRLPIMGLGALPVAATVLLLTGCGTFGAQDTGPRYEESRQVESLELPPDLISPGMERAFRIPDVPGGRVSARELEQDPRHGQQQRVADGASVLPESSEVQLRRDGQTRWLQVNATPEALWPRFREFWRSQNLTLSRDEPTVGIMETEWAENRAGIPLGGTRNLLARAVGTIYDAGTRDQYRLRVERSNGATEVFISHRGAVERGDSEGQASRWFIADPDPALEAEMLNRLLVFLSGGDPADAVARKADDDFERTGHVELVERNGQPVLVLQGEPDALWRRLGLALDRTGLMVDEQNRRDGVFFVTYRPDVADPSTQRPGLFERMFGGGRDTSMRMDQRYQVRMIENGRDLTIEALSLEGEALGSRDARFVLERIQPQLR